MTLPLLGYIVTRALQVDPPSRKRCYEGSLPGVRGEWHIRTKHTVLGLLVRSVVLGQIVLDGILVARAW